MVTRSTHVFKTVDQLNLELDLYTLEVDQAAYLRRDPNGVIFLWFHGGGFVGFNRRLLPAHVVQSCLRRGWSLVSADYRLLPQVTGYEVVKDARDAYYFVRDKLVGIVTGRSDAQPFVIMGGGSGGKHLTRSLALPGCKVVNSDSQARSRRLTRRNRCHNVDVYSAGHRAAASRVVHILWIGQHAPPCCSATRQSDASQAKCTLGIPSAFLGRTNKCGHLYPPFCIRARDASTRC